MSQTLNEQHATLAETRNTSSDSARNGEEFRAPDAPVRLDDCGVAPEVLANLALKLAYTVPRFSSEWAARKLCLPLPIVSELLEQLRTDKLIEVLGQAGAFSYTFAITGRGRETAVRLLEISGYVGAAPVSLESYTANLKWQFDHLPKASHEQVSDALSDVVLGKETVEVAGLAIMSRRSLFLNGPPGNGKTTIGHLLHNAEEGYLWIPHCIGVESSVIRVFDPQCHEVVKQHDSVDSRRNVDEAGVSTPAFFCPVAC